MGITRSGRLYENLVTTDKGKAPAIEVETRPRTLPTPSRKVTEEEADAFMKIIKASEREVNREIDLLIDIGPCSFSVTFQVLDIPNAFSLLLGRPWIHSVGAIPSSLHQKVKFVVEERIITVKGEEDYAIYKETATPYISVGNNENLPFHSFETISVIWDYGEVGPSRADRMIGKVLLRHNYIPGTGLGARGQGINRPIEVEVYKHRRGLGFRPSCHEIVEARRGNHLHRLAMHYGVHIRLAQENEELNNWTSVLRYSAVIADVYQEVFAWFYADMPGLDPSIVKHFLPLDTEKFPPKRQQLRRQRASLLLRIKEEVVKQIDAGFLEFSFMDGFSGYNQIRMAEEDKIKTTFTTMWGTFCYRVMPFGLKNAGVTYQRAMVTLFHDMMHKEVEVYVDDMIANSKEGEDHLVNLKRLFDRLKQYKLRLNPAKCTFGARSGKLLGFVNAAIEWDEECQKAFDTIKAYLVQPPVLVPPTPGRPLVLYLTADPLKYLLHSPSSARNLAKWRCQLTEYDIEYVSCTSVKGQAIADHLAEFPIEDHTPINPDFPDEGIL
ncbi:hypothetical protein CRG98_032756 [Punica granatum]|uniref:G-patch domain-containing protein n=1 Tax=Punica granatum TaxID=22663 RepID=A0A2I0ITA2_PUNGR|nr:hypothetical protein CRG98_032756 [Punica granatum]